METQNWSSGTIKRVIQNKIGVITQYDGKDVMFDLNEVENVSAKISSAAVPEILDVAKAPAAIENSEMPEENWDEKLRGQIVHFLAEQTDLGLQAKQITLLRKE